MNIVKHRKIYFIISALLMIGSIMAISVWGLNLGIDFKGGALMEVNYPEGAPSFDEVNEAVAALNFGDVSARPTGENGYILRLRSLDEPERAQLVQAMQGLGSETNYEEVRFDSIGPILGKEAARKSIISIFLVILAIIVFVTFAFRKVSEPVSSWKYGLITILALLHDILIPTGVFAVMGYFAGVEINTLFVTALLVILGFSVHDTIVVFDRVRENLKLHKNEEFPNIVNMSIRQTFTRSITTSLTTLFAIFMLYILGAESTKLFSLAMLIGIAAGTYSSLFLASPLLVTVEKWGRK